MSPTYSDLLNQLISWLALLALPLGIVCVVDDWFLRARRLASAALGASVDPWWLKIAYGLLPFTVLAILWQLFHSQRTDFGFVLVSVTTVSGLVWAFDHWVESDSWKWAIATGLLSGAAIFIKPPIMGFPLLGAFGVTLLSRLGLRNAIRSRQVWAEIGRAHV